MPILMRAGTDSDDPELSPREQLMGAVRARLAGAMMGGNPNRPDYLPRLERLGSSMHAIDSMMPAPTKAPDHFGAAPPSDVIPAAPAETMGAPRLMAASARPSATGSSADFVTMRPAPASPMLVSQPDAASPLMPSQAARGSEMPSAPRSSFMGKIGRGAERGLEALATSMFPTVMANIPGTQAYKNVTEERAERNRLAEERIHEPEVIERMREQAEKKPTTEVGLFEQSPEAFAAFEKARQKPGESPEERQEAERIKFQEMGYNVTGFDAQGNVVGVSPIPGFQPKQKDVATAEDLKNRIAQAYEKGDTATVQRLQSELKAIDPLGAERVADLEVRLRDEQSRREEAQRQFTPAIAQQVVMATTTQDSTRRLLQILAPYKEDNTPFENTVKAVEYRLGKAQADQIGQELAAINLTSLQQAGSVLKSMGGVRAARVLDKVLQHTPEPLKDSTKNMYQKLLNIDRATAVFLGDADQYGRKNPAELPAERLRPWAGTPATGRNWNPVNGRYE